MPHLPSQEQNHSQYHFRSALLPVPFSDPERHCQCLYYVPSIVYRADECNFLFNCAKGSATVGRWGRRGVCARWVAGLLTARWSASLSWERYKV